MEDLSSEHNRSTSALELRLKKIVYDNITEGIKADKLADKLNLSTDKIMQYHFSYKDFLEKQGKDIKDIKLTGISESHNSSAAQSGGSSHKKKYKKSKSKSKKHKNKNKMKRSSGSSKGGAVIERKDSVDNKIDQMEKQNILLEAIIKNNDMKEKVRKLYKNNKLDRKTRKMVRRLRDHGII
jgi:hypothetical protein